MSSELIKLTKAAVRLKMRGILKNIPLKECLQQSNKVKKKLLISPEWKKAKRISIYLSMKQEVQTDKIVEAAIEAGKVCFIPICRKDRMRMLKLNDLQDFEVLPSNSWGIREPLPAENREDAMETGGVDLVIVPGVAFTSNGDRLGHGKGYYDRFLAELKKLRESEGKPPPMTIGLAFSQQIEKTVPLNEFDVQLDRVIYPDDIITNIIQY